MAPAAAVTAQQQQQQTPVVMAPQAQVQSASQPAQPPQAGMAAATPGASVVSQVGVSPPTHPHPSFAHPLPSMVHHSVTAASRRAASRAPHPWVTGGLSSSRSWTCIQSLTHAHMHFPVMLSHKCVAAPRTVTGPEWSHTWSHSTLTEDPLETLCVGELEGAPIVDVCIL